MQIDSGKMVDGAIEHDTLFYQRKCYLKLTNLPKFCWQNRCSIQIFYYPKVNCAHPVYYTSIQPYTYMNAENLMKKNGCFTLSKDLDYNCDVLILAFILWHEHKTQKLMKTKTASSYYTSTSMQPLWENSAETQFLEITFINYNTCLRTGSKQIYLLLKCDACSTILLLFVRAVQVHLWVRLHILPFLYY